MFPSKVDHVTPERPAGYPQPQTYQQGPSGAYPQHYGYPDTAHYAPQNVPPPGYPTATQAPAAYPSSAYPNYTGYPATGPLPPNVVHYQPHHSANSGNNECRTLGTLASSYVSSVGGEASTESAIGFDASVESSGILGACS